MKLADDWLGVPPVCMYESLALGISRIASVIVILEIRIGLYVIVVTWTNSTLLLYCKIS